MSNIDSPAVARRRVRLALRSAREECQLTQSQVARAMDWSLSKVMRIEKGEVNVSPGDLRGLLEHFEIRDPDRVRQLLEDARLSRQERWTLDPADRQHFTPAMLELFQFEARATTIRYYNNQLIPGMLQAREYAEAVLAPYADVYDPATLGARVESRPRRLEQVLYRNAPPTFLVVLDESVLLRPFGGPAVMAAQLRRLLTIMREAPLLVRIMPLDTEATTLYSFGPFALHDLDGNEPSLLYRENFNADSISHASGEIDRYRAFFEALWVHALDHSASVARIEAAVRAMEEKDSTP
jgi:transcriptional regulator with XRE-family HTH domain